MGILVSSVSLVIQQSLTVSNATAAFLREFRKQFIARAGPSLPSPLMLVSMQTLQLNVISYIKHDSTSP